MLHDAPKKCIELWLNSCHISGWEFNLLEIKGTRTLLYWPCNIAFQLFEVDTPLECEAVVVQISNLLFFISLYNLPSLTGSSWRYGFTKNFIQHPRSQTIHRVCLFNSMHEGRWSRVLEWLEWRKSWGYNWR